MHIIVQLKLNLLTKNQIDILTLVKKLMINFLNLKLVILLEYQNTKIFYFPIRFEEVFVFKKTVPWIYVISTVNR